MPSTTAKLNCFIAATFVAGTILSYFSTILFAIVLPGSPPKFIVALVRLVPYIAAGVLMTKWWRNNTLVPEQIEPESSTRYHVGQCLVFLCNAAVAVGFGIAWTAKTDVDTAGAFSLMLGLILFGPALLLGMVGLIMVSGARSNNRLEGQRHE